jgi:Asparagine synthase
VLHIFQLNEAMVVTFISADSYLRRNARLLCDGNVMSMAHCLEVRPVLLDNELVEVAYTPTCRIKLQGASSKQVFIDAVAEHIPSELRNREKMGFEMLFTNWIAAGLRDSFEALLTGGAAQSLFSPHITQLCRGRFGLGARRGSCGPSSFFWAGWSGKESN